jgi:SpoVK/Ycf46/Vps4 family AAA+-type ATPase
MIKEHLFQGVMQHAGTGKTTIARRVGQLFQQLGILATAEVVSASAGDFVTGYANQSAGKTRDKFKEALGGVLFIDEAYRCHGLSLE